MRNDDPPRSTREPALKAEQLARLYRLTSESEISDATRSLVKDLLLEGLNGAVSHQAPAHVSPPVPLAVQPAPETGEPRTEAPVGRATTPPAAASPSQSASVEQIELKIRQLVEADAGWDLLEAPALALYGVRRDAVTAARVVELAFLHGPVEGVDALLARFKREVKGFYSSIHPAVRAHLVARLWRVGSGDVLAALLFHARDETYLSPVERLFVFSSMRGAKDPTTSYLYFKRHRQELLDAAYEVGAYVGVAPAAFLLAVGRLAVDLGHEDDARELLEQINSEAAEYGEALRLLLRATAERHKTGRSHYVELLAGEANPLGRLAHLRQFFTATRGLGGLRDRNRPALDDILKNPLAWFSQTPEVIGHLSETLCANRDLEPLLPSLFELFRVNVLRFLGPELDQALWQGPLAMPGEAPHERFFRGVARLHAFVARGPLAEDLLWEARELVLSARRQTRLALPCEWRELHKAAFSWLSKSPHLLEADRGRMLMQMRVAVEARSVAVVDLEDYVERVQESSVCVLKSLERIAEARQVPALERRLILKRAEATHLTNSDLDRLWRLANTRQDADLAWRAATILNARQALVPAVRHAWEISGENRTRYPFLVPSRALVRNVLNGLPADAARLANACLQIGSVLPELLAVLDPGVTMSRLPVPPADSVEATVDEALAAVSWLAPVKRRFRFSFEAAHGGAQMPAFVQVLPANPWSLLVARLAERLGANAWGFKLSRLGAQIADLIPRLASRQDLRRHSGRVARWLKDLTPEQRAAWQDLASLARTLEDDQAAEWVASFICRLATLLLPHHHLALTTLQAMRAPAGVIWSLESWLVGDAYSELREQLQVQNRVLVPNALKRLQTVLVRPDT